VARPSMARILVLATLTLLPLLAAWGALAQQTAPAPPAAVPAPAAQAAAMSPVAPAPKVDTGDTAWVLTSSALVKSKFGYDDSLDVVGVHGIGGTWGAIATGLFASKAINDAGADGLFFGNPGLLLAHLAAVVATWVFAFGGSLVLLKVVDAVIGLRVTEEEEFSGLDVSQHSENAYAFESGYGGIGTHAEPAMRREPASALSPSHT
jgi:ammonium transporter, Amt family